MLLHESADDIFSLADGADDFSLRDTVNGSPAGAKVHTLARV